MLDKAAGHWWEWGSAAQSGPAPVVSSSPLWWERSSSTVTTPKPLPANISAHLAAGAVLGIGKTCDIVILPLKPFFCKAAAFLCFSPLAEPCAFNAFSAAPCLQTKQCCCPGDLYMDPPCVTGSSQSITASAALDSSETSCQAQPVMSGCLTCCVTFSAKEEHERQLQTSGRLVESCVEYS